MWSIPLQEMQLDYFMPGQESRYYDYRLYKNTFDRRDTSTSYTSSFEIFLTIFREKTKRKRRSSIPARIIVCLFFALLDSFLFFSFLFLSFLVFHSHFLYFYLDWIIFLNLIYLFISVLFLLLKIKINTSPSRTHYQPICQTWTV